MTSLVPEARLAMNFFSFWSNQCIRECRYSSRTIKTHATTIHEWNYACYIDVCSVNLPFPDGFSALSPGFCSRFSISTNDSFLRCDRTTACLIRTSRGRVVSVIYFQVFHSLRFDMITFYLVQRKRVSGMNKSEEPSSANGRRCCGIRIDRMHVSIWIKLDKVFVN